jgi:4-azaleucine resistance transporter AzlC
MSVAHAQPPQIAQERVTAPDRSVTRAALAIGVATGTYGVSFGVLAVTAGLSLAQACTMSLLVFTGASQFAVVGVIAAGGGAVAALAPALVLAGRNAIYGFALVPVLRGTRLGRAVQAQLIIDESTAMARAQDDPAAARRAFLATGLSVFLFWNLGTLAGALLGAGLGDPRDLGLDAMFPAAFVALLGPQLRRAGAPAAAAGGALIALVLVPVAPVGVPIVVAVVGVVPAVLVARRAAKGDAA